MNAKVATLEVDVEAAAVVATTVVMAVVEDVVTATLVFPPDLDATRNRDSVDDG